MPDVSANVVLKDETAYTDEERTAVLAVRKRLIEEKGLTPAQCGEIQLIAITMTSKCRVDKAVEKFMTYQNNLLGEFGVEGDVFADMGKLHDQWFRLAVAGRDEGGRQIMWVQGGGTQLSEETACIHASVIYFFAVHADLHTLRNGITLVIDTSNNPKKKVGNERKLQVAWQNFPSRPQGIFILGTTMFTRIAINALIAFASLFAKNKVVARIRFAEVRDIEKRVGKANLPEVHGGDTRPDTASWVAERLAAFPKMDLDAYEAAT